MDGTMAGTERHTRLELCRTCLHLRGPFYDEFNRCERVQPCSCDPIQPPWNAFDYNECAELCRCCAAECVSSGSKWSLFFCEDCKMRVVAHNQGAGRCVIPIGRHSIMNGVFLSRADASNADFARRDHLFRDDVITEIGPRDRSEATSFWAAGHSVV
jgi:hypothetical protein